MRRRDFIAGAAGAAFIAGAANAVQNTPPVIGVLWHAGSPSDEQPYFDALVRGFRELGYTEVRTSGSNIDFQTKIRSDFAAWQESWLH